MLWFLFSFGVWIGCGQDFDVSPLQDEINILKQKIEVLEQNQNARIQQEEQIDVSKMQSRLQSLDDRLSKAELAIATLQEGGLTKAEYVFYDPRGTKLSNTNVQDAMTELENRLDAFEAKMLDGNLGEAGPGLYRVGHDEIKRQIEKERREEEERRGMNGPDQQGGGQGGGHGGPNGGGGHGGGHGGGQGGGHGGGHGGGQGGGHGGGP